MSPVSSHPIGQHTAGRTLHLYENHPFFADSETAVVNYLSDEYIIGYDEA